MGGLVILLVAGVLIVMAIKGTQHQVLPQLFGSQANVPGSYYQPGGVIPNNPLNPPTGPVQPDQKGNCPNGYIYFNGQCYTFF